MCDDMITTSLVCDNKWYKQYGLGYINPTITASVCVSTKKYSGAFDGFYIKEVIYNNPATIVLWSDGTKTVSKCSDKDEYSIERGLEVCILKKLITSKKYKEILDDWLPNQLSMTSSRVTLKDVIKKNKEN